MQTIGDRIWYRIHAFVLEKIAERLNEVGFTGGYLDAGHVSGGASTTLSHSATGHTAATLGNILYAAAAGVWTLLAGNTTTTRKFLRQTGTGAVSAVPAWDTLVDGDIPSLLSAVARVGVRKNSAGSTFERRRMNLIEGTNVTLTVADDSGNEEVDVTIAASGSGGTPGGSDTQVQFNDSGVFGGDAGLTYDKTAKTLTITNSFVIGTDSTDPEEPLIEITPDEIQLNAGLADGSAFEAPAIIFGPTWDPGSGAVRKQVELFSAIDNGSGLTEFTINFMQDNLSFSFYGDGTFVNQLGAATIGSSAIPWTQLFLNQYISMVEMTAPAAPAANGVLIYPEDNGAGKTRLMALFSSGAAQQIAIQP